MRYFPIFLIIVVLTGCSGNHAGEIRASGTIEAVEVIVGAKVGGQIIKMLADEGSRVKTGDTLALIDRSDLEIQFDQARANAAASEAQYRLTVLGPREEDVVQAEATLRNTEDDLNRSEELFRQTSISQKQLDDARTRYVVAKQNYEKLKRGSRREEIEAAHARNEQAATQLRSVKKKIEDSYVIAPVEGVITQKSAEEGEMAAPNSSLFKISRLSNVHLVIYVSEEELARVKLGQTADVYIDAEPAKPSQGKVIFISPVAEFTPKNIQTKEDRTRLVFGVKIEIPNSEESLKPGMPADAVIRTAPKQP